MAWREPLEFPGSEDERIGLNLGGVIMPDHINTKLSMLIKA